MKNSDAITPVLPFEKVPESCLAYLVGGTVRDLMLSRHPADYDIVVAGNPDYFARQLANENKGRIVVLGKPGLLLYRVVFPDGLVDVTEICGDSIESDLAERDFTINAMALDLATGTVIDLFDGQADIRRGVVRMISEAAFVKDPVRLIRAYRMAAVFSFTISDNTTDAITGHAHRVLSSASERIRDELVKILQCTGSADIVRQMSQNGLLEVIFPELPARPDGINLMFTVYARLEDILQNPESLFPEWADDIRGDMGTAEAGLLKCCSLFLGIEPMPDTLADAAGRTRSEKLPAERANVAAGIAGRLKFSNYQTRFIDTVIRYAPLTSRLCREGMTRREKMRFFSQFDEHVPAMILLEAAVDENAMAEVYSVFQEFYGYYRGFTRLPPLITGRDLIGELDMVPSPVFKTILSEIAEERLLGNLHTRDDALGFVSQWLARRQEQGPGRKA